MAFLELQSVTKSFAGGKTPRHVLQDVNLAVEEGEFVSVVGYSGSGKTTLLSIAAGLTKTDTGRVLVNGEPLMGFRQESTIVFQNYSLLPWFSARENVRLAVEAAFPKWTRAQQITQAEKYLEMVGLGKALDKKPSQLSGGMRQRVAIARGFAVEPRLLFLDEPFGALDALTRATLQQELARMCSASSRPVTALMITNSVEEAILLSDRIVPMSRGPKATLGPPIPVELARPRCPEMLLHDPHAVAIQGHVIEYLTGFAHAAGAGEKKTVRNVRPQAAATVEVNS